MASILYTLYAVAVLLVAVGGLLAVVFGTPDVDGSSSYWYQALAVLTALFLLAMVGAFVM